MHPKRTPINTLAQIIFLVILGLALIFAITTFRGASLGRLSPSQGATPVMTSSMFQYGDANPVSLETIPPDSGYTITGYSPILFWFRFLFDQVNTSHI